MRGASRSLTSAIMRCMVISFVTIIGLDWRRGLLRNHLSQRDGFPGWTSIEMKLISQTEGTRQCRPAAVSITFLRLSYGGNGKQGDRRECNIFIINTTSDVLSWNGAIVGVSMNNVVGGIRVVLWHTQAQRQNDGQIDWVVGRTFELPCIT